MRTLLSAVVFSTLTFLASAQGDSISRDVIYATNAGVALKLDIFLPAKVADAAPTAIYVHGGGWRNGSKSGGGWFSSVRDDLLARGYVIAAIDYRLAPDHNKV